MFTGDAVEYHAGGDMMLLRHQSPMHVWSFMPTNIVPSMGVPSRSVKPTSVWVDGSTPPKTGKPPPHAVEGLTFWLIFNMCVEFAALFTLMTPTVTNYYTHDL